MTTPKVSYKTITPEEAHVLLKRSKRKNVPVKKSKIDQYARDMINDKWDPNNSQAVSIDTEENIVNGHQRLRACIQAGKPFRTLFITGVPPETFQREDTGRSRDAGHYFALLGEKHYLELAAGSRAMYFWERGMWKLVATAGVQYFIPNEDLLEEVERRPELRKAAAWYAKVKQQLRGRFTAGAAISLWVLGRGHPRHEDFWKEVAERLTADRESPAYNLNRRVDAAKAQGKNLTKIATLALLTKAWNFYSAGETTRLSFDVTNEAVPQPITELVPALLPKEEERELIVTTPKTIKKPRPVDVTKVLKVVPKPEKKPRPKKGPKLRGGLNSA